MRARRPSDRLLAAVVPLLFAAPACEADPGDDLKGVDAAGATASAGGAAADASVSGAGPGGASSGASSGGSTGGGGGTGGNGGSGGADGGSSGAATDAAASRDAQPSDASPPSCDTCALRVEYRTGVTASVVNEIKPHVTIVNAGAAAQPLADLTLRYWYTSDGAGAESYACDYAKIDCANVRGALHALPSAVPGADAYLELSFTAAAGSIAPSQDSGEIQSRFHKDDYANYTQTNDYSFDGTKGQFAEWSHVTLYRAGKLVWGVEPH